jgi:hypothetical protein
VTGSSGFSLCGFLLLQASFLDCVAFDPFSFQQDCLTTPEVHVGRCQIAQALMIAPMVVVIDEPANAGLKVTRQEVVFQENAVLERLMPTFDLALCLGMVGRAATVLPWCNGWGPGGGWYCVFGSQAPPIPLTVAIHCSRVTNPQL